MSLGATSNRLQNNFKEVKPNRANVYEFENFRLDAAHLMLYRDERVVPLTPKVVETLVALVEHRGEVVSKEELMDRLWSDTAVEESNLSQNLYVLRKTLGNCPDGKPLIETFRRRGYRFNGQIQETREVELLVATHTKTLTVTEEETSEQNFLPTTSRKYFLAASAGLVGLALLALGVFRFLQPELRSSQNGKAIAADIKLTRLMPDQNMADAAISPDGRYLAYALFENGKSSLWLKDIASGSTTQIMPLVDNESYRNLVFSPDGTQIFYNTSLKSHPNFTIFRIPVFGGESQKIAENVVSPATISPDGRQIAFVRWGDAAEGRLIVAAADGSGERILSVRKRETGWYESWGSNLSWSPDGQKIALCGGRIVDGKSHYELIEVSVADGVERNIPTPDWNYLDDVVWLSDQSGLLVRARETETSPWQIWRIPYPVGGVGRVTNDTNDYDSLSLTGDARQLVVMQTLGNLNLWTIPLADASRARQISFGNAASDGFYGLAFTPDGNIIYTSLRSGNVDLWTMNKDGSEQKQLTKNAGQFNGRPLVTPDGRSIVFVSSRTGVRQIWRMDADGGNPQRLTDAIMTDQPYLSPDGAWIYFTLWQNKRQIIAKISILGGEPVSVYDKNNPYRASVSPDGRQMLFGFYEEGSPQPWTAGLLSLDSGELKPLQINGFSQVWTTDSKSLVVARGNPTNLWETPLDGSQPRQLTKFDSGQIRNFAISPDFKQIVAARGNPSAEAILITNF